MTEEEVREWCAIRDENARLRHRNELLENAVWTEHCDNHEGPSLWCDSPACRLIAPHAA